MAENSHIEWTKHTFNPWIGCTKVGPGCDHCYAEAWDARGLQGLPTRWGPDADRTRTSVANWRKPLAWSKAAAALGEFHRTFCASLADFLDNHKSISDEMRRDLGKLIEATPNLIWMLLSKRIGNAAKYLPIMFPNGVPKNVWLGITIVTQAEADRDSHKLAKIKANFGISISFFSMVPLIEAVTIDPHFMPDLVIVGGESGKGARPMHPRWVKDIRDLCVAAGVAFHFKQWGEWAPCIGLPVTHRWTREGAFAEFNGGPHYPGEQGAARIGKKAAGRLLDGRTWDEMPGAAPERAEVLISNYELGGF